ncbi:MAG: DUF4097 family beta strand repeat protein [Clostridia bacterium]|nr:DUF4097 family beta strand repeat protein [Clostridia bacterium]
MTRDQKIKIAMIICATVLACAVIITATGMFSGGISGLFGYSNAEKYTAGGAAVKETVKNLEIHWTSGKVTVAYHPENTVILEETASRSLSEDEQLHWWLDGDTLRVQLCKAGARISLPSKQLKLTLPEGMRPEKASFSLTSGDLEIPEIRTEKLEIHTTSGNLNVKAETPNLKAETTSGSAVLVLTGENRIAECSCTSGGIRLTAGKTDRVKMSSTSGSLEFDGEESKSLEMGSTSGSVLLKVRKFENVAVGCTSGDVTARLPENPGFRAEISTTSGKVSTGLALKQEGKTYTCGDESGKLDIHTTSGDVRLEKAD